MTRYKYSEANPKNPGFYRVFDSNTMTFAAYYTGEMFIGGPYLGKALILLDPITDDEVYEWEVWK